MKDEDLLFYDMEDFKYDTLIILKDINHNTVATFWNDQDKAQAEGTKEFGSLPTGFEGLEEIIKDKILVGYNNHHYDDKLLKAVLDGKRQSIVNALSNTIIANNGKDLKTVPVITLDVMQQISVSTPSLKKIEGNMGISIVESSIPFDIDRPLTEQERKETEFYCSHDIDATIEAYKIRKKAYFEPKEALIKRLPESIQSKAYKWNTTSISAKMLLGDNNISYYAKWNRLAIPDHLWRNVDGIPPSVWDMWLQAETSMLQKDYPVKSVEVELLGNIISFGFGGLHGVPPKPGTWHNVRLLDVGSMYPSLIRMLNALGSATEVYDGLRQERLKIKHVDKTLSDALKLVLNSVYGNLKNQYSPLYAPKASATVCIYGQIAVFVLARELHEAGFEVININTDGVAFVGNGDVSEVVKVWETMFDGMVLEEDRFTKWIQKDVNNYIAVTPEGKIKVKGREVKRYHDNFFFDDNSCRIFDIATVDYLVHGTPVVDTLYNNLDKPILYQYILKAGSTYEGVCDEKGNMMNKVNRVFARRKTSCLPDTKLFKVREDGAAVNFPDVPDSMFVWNEDVSELSNPEENIDLSHYHRLIKHRLEGWGCI